VLPAAGGAHQVAGLAVAERSRRALECAGFTLVEPGSGPPGPHTLFVAGDAAVEPQALLALAEAAVAGRGSMSAENAIEAPAALVVPAGGPAGGALVSAEDLGPLAARLRETDRLRLAATGGALCQRIQTHGDALRLERRMLGALAQPTDGFFARHFDRRISSRLSPRLVRLGVRPNTITLFATGVGLAGAACLATPSHALQVLGALLFVASTILDGCDGEVARLSFTSSDFGRRLDLIGDNLVNAAIFVAIGWNALATGAGHGPSWLVWATLGGFVLATAAGFAFSRWINRSGRKAELHDWYESLASRDFAYFVLLLAMLGRLPWFVWFAAIGSYAFVALLAVIWLRAGREPAPPLGERECT
jgi:phosphatidylglycerophosphate synthase